MPNIFNLSIPQLGQWSRRQLPDHRQLNEPVEAINRMITGIGPPRMKAGMPIISRLTAQFRLKQNAADFADHLVCRTWDGIIEGAQNVLIAKPWLLQQTPFDDETRENVRYEYSDGITRTAYDITDPTEQLKREEQIHPRYLVDDIIIATVVATGLIVAGLPVLWVDVNVDSRGWRTYYEWL